MSNLNSQIYNILLFYARKLGFQNLITKLIFKDLINQF